ncbi:MAG: response regulator transcription factor, partial [Nitriliruptoraceae bacterium]
PPAGAPPPPPSDGLRRLRSLGRAGRVGRPDWRAEVARELRDGAQEDPRLASLSEQERRILALIAEGLTNREIGGELHLAEKTVKNYVSNLLAKLDMQRRTEAAVFYTRVQQEQRDR